MDQFVLTCCSTADMTDEYFAKRHIPYVCFHFTLDGVEYPDDLGKSVPFDQFYKRISEGAAPTTSQVNETQFSEFFEPFLKEGKDILHISLSTGLSGAYNSACLAANALLEKYPERAIRVVDSLGASSGYGLLMDTAADLRDQGKTLDETADWVESHKLNLHHWFFSTDLTSYLRGGRITKTSFLFGSLLNICPLLNMNHLGQLIPRTKYQGKKRVCKEIVERMKQHADDGLAYSGKCFICNSACYEDARYVADLVEATFPNLNGKVLINSVGTVIGAHTGPGTVALFFFGDKRVD
jgi:DegV family protein with EDD domain